MVVIVVTVEEAVDVSIREGYQSKVEQKEQIVDKLREKGCRITAQRLRLLDIILENECSSCKEIFYIASKKDNRLGTATVYRMVNLLEEIGAISRKNMYKVAYSENCNKENVCTIQLEDGTVLKLSGKDWHNVITKGLKESGYVKDQTVSSVSVKPCNCGHENCHGTCE